MSDVLRVLEGHDRQRATLQHYVESLHVIDEWCWHCGDDDVRNAELGTCAACTTWLRDNSGATPDPRAERASNVQRFLLDLSPGGERHYVHVIGRSGTDDTWWARRVEDEVVELDATDYARTRDGLLP